jgi:ABC-type Fe3+-hydroxamate transport system substrate-binding protein
VAAALTPERKRILLIGLGLILVVLLAKQFLLKKSVPEAITIPLTVHHAVPAKHTPKHAQHVIKIDPSLPAALRTALRRHPVVVAMLYARHAPGDDAALKAARAGAHGAHAGFAVLDVSKEKIAQLVALKLPGIADPSVVVVRRPGKFKVLLSGFADSDAVAEAVHNAR